MITFKQNGIVYKIYFKYQRKPQQNKFSKLKIEEKDSTICVLENSREKINLLETISECSPEDNFSREIGRQITLVRLLNHITYDANYNNVVILNIIKDYFKGRETKLPEKESKMLNNILIFILTNNANIG
jgi:hypothetical protein